jgi:DNA-binding XRE family transcriptional regulator
MPEYFSNNLVFLREKKGETQTETATALGFSRSTYVNYEVGANVPKLDAIMKIIGHFSVSFEDMTKVDLRNVNLNGKKSDNQEAKNVNLKVNPNVNPNPKTYPDYEEFNTLNEPEHTYGSPVDYKAKYYQLLGRLEADQANFQKLQGTLQALSARYQGMALYLAQTLSPLVSKPENVIMAELNTAHLGPVPPVQSGKKGAISTLGNKDLT